MEYFLMALKKYADFNGRARRKEYWMFTLFFLIFYCAAIAIDLFLGSYFMITLLLLLGLIIPSISVAVRRLHDVGKSGWYYWVQLIPLAGAIWLLVLLVTEGDRGANEYGPDPKGNGEIDLVDHIN